MTIKKRVVKPLGLQKKHINIIVNIFVLGSIAMPLLVSVFELCIHINELWHWFGTYEFFLQ